MFGLGVFSSWPIRRNISLSLSLSLSFISFISFILSTLVQIWSANWAAERTDWREGKSWENERLFLASTIVSIYLISEARKNNLISRSVVQVTLVKVQIQVVVVVVKMTRLTNCQVFLSRVSSFLSFYSICVESFQSSDHGTRFSTFIPFSVGRPNGIG